MRQPRGTHQRCASRPHSQRRGGARRATGSRQRRRGSSRHSAAARWAPAGRPALSRPLAAVSLRCACPAASRSSLEPLLLCPQAQTLPRPSGVLRGVYTLERGGGSTGCELRSFCMNATQVCYLHVTGSVLGRRSSRQLLLPRALAAEMGSAVGERTAVGEDAAGDVEMTADAEAVKSPSSWSHALRTAFGCAGLSRRKYTRRAARADTFARAGTRTTQLCGHCAHCMLRLGCRCLGASWRCPTSCR